MAGEFDLGAVDADVLNLMKTHRLRHCRRYAQHHHGLALIVKRIKTEIQLGTQVLVQP